jgi:hypothetical protein
MASSCTCEKEGRSGMSADGLKLTKARKNYRCDCCKEPIPKGTEYRLRVVPPWECFDGDKGWWTFHMHPACEAIMNAVATEWDNQLPEDRTEWREMVESYRTKREKEGAA